MSVWAMAIVAASSAVITPTHAIMVESHGEAACSIGLTRTIRYTPAVTMVAAWMRADTGVGPAMASGSHRYSGSCALLPTAPMNNMSEMSVAVVVAALADMGRNCVYWIVPKVNQVTKMPTMKPQSPTRLVMKAFLAALALAGTSNQNAMRK